MVVQLIKVHLPVAMKRGREVDLLGDGRDPDGVEAHALDVVEMADGALIGSSAVYSVAGVARCGGAAIGSGEAVSQYLVDGP